MSTIATLSGRSEFAYSGNCEEGFFLEYTGRPFVSPELVSQLLQNFRGQEVPGGFNMDNPSGLGLWLTENTVFSSKHGSHIAAVMVHEGLIGYRQEAKKIYLQF